MKITGPLKLLDMVIVHLSPLKLHLLDLMLSPKIKSKNVVDFTVRGIPHEATLEYLHFAHPTCPKTNTEPTSSKADPLCAGQ